MLLFDRKIQLITESGLTFNNWDGVQFNFKYSTIDETGVPTAEIEILNIDKTIMNEIKEEGAIFSIGYESYLGDLITGDIKNIEIGDTIIFDIIGNSTINSKEYDNWYNTNVRENFIVEDIAKNNGIILEGTDLLKDYIRPNGYTVTGSAIKSIISLVSNRGLGITFKGKTLKIYKLEGNADSEITLDITSGLTNVTKYQKRDNFGNLDTKYDYVIHSLPIPKLIQGEIFQIIHDNFTGKVVLIDFEILGRKNWKAKYYVKVISE